MDIWKSQLEKYNSLLKLIDAKKENSKELLRFDRCTIRASDVAGQYYCEKKIEMKYLYGDVETETKNQGTAAHEKLLEGAEIVDQESLWKTVYGKEPVLAMEWLLLSEYEDVILTGQPDSVLFENGEPLVIFEYKFSRRKKVCPSHHVQAGFYGILLKNLGFNIEKLFYAIVVADRKLKCNPDLKDTVLNAVRNIEPRNVVIPIENAIIYFNKFDEKQAKASVEWAIKFWKNQREAISTQNPYKCRICEYEQRCRKFVL
ncbi:MAG: PD-(D/E)XK nuclease family protein [Candidatus Bathyarchaeota archaeon]